MLKFYGQWLDWEKGGEWDLQAFTDGREKNRFPRKAASILFCVFRIRPDILDAAVFF